MTSSPRRKPLSIYFGKSNLPTSSGNQIKLKQIWLRNCTFKVFAGKYLISRIDSGACGTNFLRNLLELQRYVVIIYIANYGPLMQLVGSHGFAS